MIFFACREGNKAGVPRTGQTILLVSPDGIEPSTL